MNPKTSISKQRVACPLICRICGGIARGTNFSTISCMSCKMFFRRHGKSQLLEQQCHFDSKCDVTEKTRKYCVPCRLRKCLEAGMDTKLFRHSSKENKNIQLPKPTSLSLLDKDRSLLTLDEWNLLTNVINSYDEQNLFAQVKYLSNNQLSLPPKFRCKDSNTLNHIASLFSTLHTFIERCPLFYSLPLTIRNVLVNRNLGALGGYNGLFMAKVMNAFENEIYSKLIDNIYGDGHSKIAIQACQRLDQNGTLIKVMLMIMIFSTNCAIVSNELSNNVQIIFDPKIVLHTQNIFVNMLWKYLIYQYGSKEAILRFMSLVKSVLDMIQRMAEGLNIRRHWTMLEKVVEQKTHLLSLEDARVKQ